MNEGAAAFAPGQHIGVRMPDGRRVPAYLRSIGDYSDSMALVVVDGTAIEVPWRNLVRVRT